MAHEILENGHMIFSGKKPWHKQGIDVTGKEIRSIAQAFEFAPDIDFPVEVVPCYIKGADGTEIMIDRNAIMNGKTNEILGNVSSTWHPVQIKSALSIIDGFLQNDLATLETLISLGGGQKVCALARLSGDPIDVVPGDRVDPYLLNAVGNDGKIAVHLGTTATRVVCANTLRVALKESGNQVRIRHTKKADETIASYKEAALAAYATFQKTASIWKDLACHACTEAQLRNYVRSVIPGLRKKANQEVITQDAAKANEIAYLDNGADFASLLQKPTQLDADAKVERSSRVEDRIVELFETGRGSDITGVRGTVWGAYNAVTEYLSHERGRSDDSRFVNLQFGEIGHTALVEAQKLLSA
jgi:phage/plasmid-like protein (TIGR03299 family)